MDVRFENRYKVNELMLREYVYKVVSRNIVLMSVGVFLLGLVVLVVGTANRDYLLMSLAGVCMVIAVFMGMLTPQLVLRQIHETSDRQNNGRKYETVVRFGEKITVEEGAVTTQYDYSQITKIHNLKHSYMLMLDKQNGIMLSKTGFMDGNFKEFRQFIQKKTGKKG